MAVQRSAQSFLRADLSPYFKSSYYYASRSRPRHPPVTYIAAQSSMSFQTCQFSSSTRHPQQAAAPKSDGFKSSQHQPREDRKQALEPSRRITLAERHTTAPPTEPPPRTSQRRDTRTAFLNNAHTAPATSARPSPQTRKPQQLGTQSPSSSSSGQGQKPSPDFAGLYADAGSKLDFAKGRSVRPGGNQEQYTAAKDGRTSIEELLGEFGLERRDQGRTSGSTPYRDGDRRTFDFSGMQRPYANLLSEKPDARTLAKQLDEYNKALAKTMASPTFRVGPGLGRTVVVAAEKGMDVARAFQMVNVKCNANSVKQDLNAQRFHERPGTRRKRLASVRWRRRFKEAFRATIRRVEDMRRKGW